MRVLPSLPPEALEALRLVTNDPIPSVADAAQRAIALHTPKLTPDTANEKEQEQNLEQDMTITSHFKVNGFLVGGIAGFIGGYAKIYLSDIADFGVWILCLFMPVISPIAGALSVFVVNYFIEKSKPYYLFFCVFIGFLAGFLPFFYWFAL